MPLFLTEEPKKAPIETLLFVLTGFHGQAAIDKLLADMTNDNDGKEVTRNGSTKKAG